MRIGLECARIFRSHYNEVMTSHISRLCVKHRHKKLIILCLRGRYGQRPVTAYTHALFSIMLQGAKTSTERCDVNCIGS